MALMVRLIDTYVRRPTGSRILAMRPHTHVGIGPASIRDTCAGTRVLATMQIKWLMILIVAENEHPARNSLYLRYARFAPTADFSERSPRTTA